MEVEPANLQSQLHRLAERVRTVEEQYFDQNETNKFVVDEIILVHRECYTEHNVETSHIEWNPDDDNMLLSKVISATLGGTGWTYEVEPTASEGPEFRIVVSETLDEDKLAEKA